MSEEWPFPTLTQEHVRRYLEAANVGDDSEIVVLGLLSDGAQKEMHYLSRIGDPAQVATTIEQAKAEIDELWEPDGLITNPLECSHAFVWRGLQDLGLHGPFGGLEPKE